MNSIQLKTTTSVTSVVINSNCVQKQHFGKLGKIVSVDALYASILLITEEMITVRHDDYDCICINDFEMLHVNQILASHRYHIKKCGKHYQSLFINTVNRKFYIDGYLVFSMNGLDIYGARNLTEVVYIVTGIGNLVNGDLPNLDSKTNVSMIYERHLKVSLEIMKMYYFLGNLPCCGIVLRDIKTIQGEDFTKKIHRFCASVYGNFNNDNLISYLVKEYSI